MDKMKRNFMVISGVEVVVAIAMWLITTKIAPVCTGMLELVSGKQVHMKCHYAAVVFVFIAALFLVNGLLAMFVKPSVVSGVIAIAAAILVYVTLNDAVGIGVCANPEMACQTTAPLVKVCAAIGLVCGAIQTFMAAKNK